MGQQTDSAMSLSFLSKKSWHTTNLKNVEKVWLAEQEQQKEEQKLERWKKEREDERQQAELRSLQDEMTKTKRETRVDFLYEQPQTNAQEYLLGKAVVEKPEEADIKKVEVLPGSNFINGQNNLSNQVNGEFNKLNNDPLIMMRSEEQKALQRILSNPLKMKSIRGAVEQRAAATESKGKKSKKEKKGKKEKKEEKSK